MTACFCWLTAAARCCQGTRTVASGLGSGPITLFGPPELKARYLPAVAQGKAIAGFALTEPEAGSDVAALAMTAKPDGGAQSDHQATAANVKTALVESLRELLPLDTETLLEQRYQRFRRFGAPGQQPVLPPIEGGA